MLNWHTGNIQRVARRPALTTCGCLLPDSGDREAIELNVLDDFVQEPVSHGIEICKRVHLQTREEKGVGSSSITHHGTSWQGAYG